MSLLGRTRSIITNYFFENLYHIHEYVECSSRARKSRLMEKFRNKKYDIQKMPEKVPVIHDQKIQDNGKKITQFQA